MKQNETNLSPKIPKYTCELCEMSTNNKKDYTKHMSTAKHEKREKCNKMKQICPQKSRCARGVFSSWLTKMTCVSLVYSFE